MPTGRPRRWRPRESPARAEHARIYTERLPEIDPAGPLDEPVAAGLAERYRAYLAAAPGGGAVGAARRGGS